MKLRILIAEDNKAVRDVMRLLLEAQPGWKVVAVVTNGREAVEEASRLQPDVAILDYSMPELDGLSAATQIRQAAPGAGLLVLTVHDAPFTVRRALDSGICGYVVKSDAARDLLPAVKAVAAHKIYLSSTIAYVSRGDNGQPPDA
jgi:DNA-binding NarL/FixJ family response regulator